MTTQTEALKLALEALDQLTNVADTFSVSGVYLNEEVWAKKCLSDAYFAITTIEEALAQQSNEQVEPVEYKKARIHWLCQEWKEDHLSDINFVEAILAECLTHPPVPTAQPKPLTDEQIDAVMPQPTEFGIVQPPWNGSDITILRAMARAIEAAHGIVKE